MPKVKTCRGCYSVRCHSANRTVAVRGPGIALRYFLLKRQESTQTYQAPSGPTTTKTIYKHCYRHAYPLGSSQTDPNPAPDYIEDKNGHILPYVRFTGGRLQLTPEALTVLDHLAGKQAVKRKLVK